MSTNNTISRRDFMKLTGMFMASATVLAACTKNHPSEPVTETAQVLDIHESNSEIYKRASLFFRPLAGSNPNFEFSHDKVVLSTIKKWLDYGIILAGNRHKLDFDPVTAFQLANRRPDLNAYVFSVTDKDKIVQVLKQAKNVQSDVGDEFPNGFGDLEILWGTVFWLRQITDFRPNIIQYKQEENRSEATLKEAYWMDVWIRSNDLAFPFLRVYCDSVGFVSFPEAEFNETAIQSAFNEESIFIESHNIVLNWHELATQCGLEHNFYYLRTMLKSSQNIDGICHEIDETGTKDFGLLSNRGMVYFCDNSELSSGDVGITFRLDVSRSIDEQIAKMGFSDFEQFYLYLNNTNFQDIYLIPKSVWGGILPSSIDSTYSLIAHSPGLSNIVNLWQPGGFPDGTSEGDEFVFFILSVLGPGIKYIGQGKFELTFDDIGTAAAQNGTRQSPFESIVYLVPPTAADLGVLSGAGSVGAAGGEYLANALEGLWKSYPERDKLIKTVQGDAQWCATSDPNVLSEGQCEQCVEDKGHLDQLRNAIKSDYIYKRIASAGASFGVGCALGAAAGTVGLAAIGAGAGCLLGGLIALALSIAKGGIDYITYRAEVNNATNQGFSPCHNMPIEFDFGQ